MEVDAFTTTTFTPDPQYLDEMRAHAQQLARDGRAMLVRTSDGDLVFLEATALSPPTFTVVKTKPDRRTMVADLEASFRERYRRKDRT